MTDMVSAETVDRSYLSLSCQERAEQAVIDALSRASWVAGAVTLPSDEETNENGEWERTYTQLEELLDALAELYRAKWMETVPFDSGEVVFEPDEVGAIADILAHEEYTPMLELAFP